MALVLTTEEMSLVHTSDPTVTAPDGVTGWIPASDGASDGSTRVEVRALSGIEFARAAASADSATELEFILSTAVVSVNSDKAAAKEATKWPYHLAHPLRQAIIHVSLGGELPLGRTESAEPETE